MKIVVTGAVGFIGTNFTEYILQSYPDDTVIAIDSLTYAANLGALESLKKNPRFIFYRADICDSAVIDEIFRLHQPDAVVNFAAESHVDRSISDAAPFIRTNVLGTQVLLDASVKYNAKRFHQISTDEVYGDTEYTDTRLFYEDSPLRPSSPYSASKAAADLLALSYFRTHALPVTISRCSNNYGPYQHSEKLIPKIISRAVRSQSALIYGDGLNVRDWIYVLDHCRAVDMILRGGEAGQIYNVGATCEINNLSLAKMLQDRLGVPRNIEYIEDRKGHDRRYAISSKKIREQLGWTPLTEFDEGIDKTVRWYLQNGGGCDGGENN